MNWTLEVVVVPVSDVSRANAFYSEQLGFRVDHDTQVSPTSRVVQLTPPGSGCSVVLGNALQQMAAGSLKGLQLVVSDLRIAHAELTRRGVKVSEVSVIGAGGRRTAQDGEALNYVGFIFFSDPDGNAWAVQQIDSRQ
ncbi:glyoxalase [Deinococcus detaillensis]|uniref:Glyoxalase n=1 Tax=Deinococcus detaillensis TaxID=2592048 RepID=A0A553UZP8_9DEIO|nr:VOC family protein [Deinococcus detaillensis]TSA85697.1 glyoxalase [Deinococcus detaillensis]